VVEEFIALAASRGVDVFRIFDCFNDMNQMRISIEAVRKAGKIAEVCICYTGDITTSSIYDLAYYKGLAQQCVEAGAHIIGVKDMAGA
jgi:pyruvate carboxylase